MKKCTVCGAQVKDDDTYCRYCGADLTQTSDMYKNKSNSQEGSRSSILKYKDFMDSNALYNMALCKQSGIGAEKDEDEAFSIFQALSFRGHYDAMYKLAEMYLAQTPPDYETAYMWLKIAADSGHSQSKIRLKVLSREFAPFITTSKETQIPGNGGAFETLVNSAMQNIVLIKSIFRRSQKSSIVNSGAGFIIEGGYVITNAHVIGDNPDCVIASFETKIDDKSYNLLPIVVRKNLDVAVLKFTGLMADKIEMRDNLKLRAELPYYGEEVYTVGNPLGIGFSVSKGIISCPNRESNYPSGVDEVIQTDITANHGNSGGALLDNNNNVLGMVTFTPGNSAGGISMCVPSKYIVDVLNSLN